MRERAHPKWSVNSPPICATIADAQQGIAARTQRTRIFRIGLDQTGQNIDCFPRSLIKRVQTRQPKSTVAVFLESVRKGLCIVNRVGNSILNASNILDMKASDEYYEEERHKNRMLEDIGVRFAFEVSFFNLSEFLKSGALLSCLVMHLNRRSYDLVLM